MVIFNCAVLPREKDTQNMKSIQIIVSVSFTIWSIYEFFFVSCVSNLDYTLLYKILLTNVIVGVIGTFFIFLCIPIHRFINLRENT
jgi:hypothetical protein